MNYYQIFELLKSVFNPYSLQHVMSSSLETKHYKSSLNIASRNWFFFNFDLIILSRGLSIYEIDNKENYQLFLEKWYRNPVFKNFQSSDSFQQLLNQKLSHFSKEKTKNWSQSLKLLSLSHQSKINFEKFFSQEDWNLHFSTGAQDQKFTELFKQLKVHYTNLSLKIFQDQSHNIHGSDPALVKEWIESFSPNK